jgi:hypothetical protein
MYISLEIDNRQSWHLPFKNVLMDTCDILYHYTSCKFPVFSLVKERVPNCLSHGRVW